MVRKIKYCFYLCLLSGALFAQNAQRIPDELIVQLFKDVSIENVVSKINSDNALQIKINKTLSERLNIYTINFDAEIINAEKIYNIFFTHPLVANVQFNHVTQQRSLPDDPLFYQQWNMYNDGTTGGLEDSDIDAELAWDIATGGLTALGDTIVVAVVGEGAEFDHEDLNYWKNYNEIPLNLIDDDGNGYIDDYDGWNSTDTNGIVPDNRFHGSHVAGIIGAKGNNGIGVAGVNWNVKILPVHNISNEADAVASYSYVFVMRELYDQTDGAKGAFIVATNSSFGVDFGNPDSFPIWCAMYDSLGSLGILSVGATANFSANIDVILDIPTACPSNHLVTVTNTDKADNLFIAAYGPNSIDLGAPGQLVYSTQLDNLYGFQSGTSMSAPHIAGTIALLFSAACEKFMLDYKYNPSSMALLLKDYILNGVDFVDDLNGITVSNGRLNVFHALNNLVETGYCSGDNIDDQNTAFALNCYPNPVSEKLFISSNNILKESLLINIFNETGQLVYSNIISEPSELSMGLSVDAFSDGLYFLRINELNSQNKFTSSFIIQH